jgi:hypothetical protein
MSLSLLCAVDLKQWSKSSLLKHPYEGNENNRSQYRDQDAWDETPTRVEAQHAHDPATDDATHNAKHDIHERSIPRTLHDLAVAQPAMRPTMITQISQNI